LQHVLEIDNRDEDEDSVPDDVYDKSGRSGHRIAAFVWAYLRYKILIVYI